ncbi:MAG TPA: carboxylating nicotinate-nucleotide diphosphorylase [bacterium]|nr:carboxylating nicotinate-nucleotide diphosphorylase [bacterium]
MPFDKEKLTALIRTALQEDLPKGDLTCNAVVPNEMLAKGKVISKADYVVSGIELAEFCYAGLDKGIKFSSKFKDSQKIKKGEILFEVYGNAAVLLKVERTVLNIVSHMMGVATKTSELVELVKGTNAKILDTRKTLPGLRYIQKLAVLHGGGTNHRASLSDAILIKENHIACAGGIQNALKAIKGLKGVQKEIEVRSIDELQEVLSSNVVVDIVMLDNMEPKKVKEAVNLVKGKFKLEVSGGINSKNIRPYAEAGVDLISVGALTHSVTAADLSFLFEGV